jgi:hypothetical protein
MLEAMILTVGIGLSLLTSILILSAALLMSYVRSLAADPATATAKAKATPTPANDYRPRSSG